jgi:hypothetical protein
MFDQFDTREKKLSIEPLDSAASDKLARQRELVRTLARRYIGSLITGTSLADLRIVQRLVDRHPTFEQGRVLSHGRVVIEKDRLYEMQSLGVVVGDVMAHQFDLEWVIVDDKYGRGRALNVKGTTDLVFPVTIISKLYEAGLPVDVKAIFDDIAATLAMRPEPPKKRRLPVFPVE